MNNIKKQILFKDKGKEKANFVWKLIAFKVGLYYNIIIMKVGRDSLSLPAGKMSVAKGEHSMNKMQEKRVWLMLSL